MVICCVYGCRSRSDKKEPGITFHRFPLKDLKKTKLWMQDMHLADWMPNKNTRICSKHFLSSHFYRIGAKTCLLNEAVPTVFEELPPYMRTIEQKIRTKRPIQDSLEPLIQDSLEPSIQNRLEPPIQDSLEPLIQGSLEPSIQNRLEPPIQDSSEPSIQDRLEPPIRDSLEPPMQDRLEPPIQDSLEPPIQDSLEPPIQDSLEPTHASGTNTQDNGTSHNNKLRRKLFLEVLKSKEKSHKIRVLGQKLKRYEKRIISLKQIIKELKGNNLSETYLLFENKPKIKRQKSQNTL